MFTKKFVAGLCCGILALMVSGCSLLKKEVSSKPAPSVETKQAPAKAVVVKPTPQATPAPAPVVKKYDLYSSTPYDLPLISVVEISSLPPLVKKSVDEILEASQGFYLLKYDKKNKNVHIILQNPVNTKSTFQRHGLEFVQIASDGSKTFVNSDMDENSENDLWEFDKSNEQEKPLKHTVVDSDGKIKYIETWNYNSDEPVKYEMKDSDGKPVSIFKETFEGDSNYRQEHIFYDKDGNTKMSISANYDGADISRFTYYNSEDLDDSISIMSEYENGVKVKEDVYNKDYELINTYESKNVDGERKSIKIFDKDKNQVAEISG